MDKIFKVLDKIEDFLLAAFITAMVIIIFIATVFRFLEISTFSWSEEAARYLMIALIFIGISKGARLNAHFTVSNFVDMAPKSLHKFLFYVRSVIIIVFCGFMSYQMVQFIGNIQRMKQKSPALQIPMWIIYTPLLIGFVGIILRNLQWLFWPETLHLDKNTEEIGEV